MQSQLSNIVNVINAPRIVMTAGGIPCVWSVSGMAKQLRQSSGHRWRHAFPDPAGCLLLARELGISSVIAQLLYNRGLTTPQVARAFLTAGREQILDPFLLKDMDRAVRLLQDRIRSGKSILVYGDYDVDGVTGTAILVLALRALGADVTYYIPNRFSEGYGLNTGALEELLAQGNDFVLTVDTGVTAVKEAEAARQMGMTLLVTDHHEPGAELPDLPALLNPKRPDCTYPFKGLSGVGVAFKLALALEAPGAWDLLDIAALGTIADMVPLVGENRAIVREGLAALGGTKRLGLRALMEVAGVKQPVTATHIGYALGPRINALGRMGSAMKGVELILTADHAIAIELARHLDAENKSRQEAEASILAEVLEQAEAQRPCDKEFVLVLAGEGWHHGVIGICASRVLEVYHRPVIILSMEGEEVRGSARSIPAFHLHRALSQVSDLFLKFGGHAAAAGMTLIGRDAIGPLRERLNRIGAAWLHPDDLVPELKVDAYIELSQVTEALMTELRALEPHGIGNPAPVFAARELQVHESRTMGQQQQHLKLRVTGPASGPMLEAVGWNMAAARPAADDQVQIAFKPEYDTFGGRNQLRITMKDLQQVNSPRIVSQPELTARDCLAWDPVVGLQEAVAGVVQTVWDGRDSRLGPLLGQLNQPLEAVAAAAERQPERELASPEPTRNTYLEALLSLNQAQVLVLTASPWAAVSLLADLELLMPERTPLLRLWLPGAPEPTSGVMVIAPYGCEPSRHFTDTVCYHPPYHRGQVSGERLHLLWQEHEWERAGETLGWPYPDRAVLVEVYKLLKTSSASSPARSPVSSPASSSALASALALTLGEVPGPWNALRLEAALAIFQELGLVDLQGRLVTQGPGEKLVLQGSPRYQRGLQGREALTLLKARHWPSGNETL